MSLTGRIRISLLLAALAPPLLVMLSLYVWVDSRTQMQRRQAAAEAVERFSSYLSQWQQQTDHAAADLAASRSVSRAVALLQADRVAPIDISIDRLPLDFVELVDAGNICRYSLHRPGLVGERLKLPPTGTATQPDVQYDLDGAHAAYTVVAPLPDQYRLYTGRYFDSSDIAIAKQLLDAPVILSWSGDADEPISRMEPRQVYAVDSVMQSLLWGGSDAGFFLSATFDGATEQPQFVSLFYITGIVALASVAFAVFLGFYFTGRAKREIDNLVAATNRVAGGDFATPVMAYEEGEFSQLADSFSDMMYRLRRAQDKLAVSEKIAAWQAMARKIAHEIKNPLSPIAISADDLRQSYREQLPDFETTLLDTTGTIKNEVRRLTRLLDEFVAFARMAPPDIQTVPPEVLSDNILSLYRTELEQGRLTVKMTSSLPAIEVDPDSIQRLLVNLIKNGLEASPESHVNVTMTDDSGEVVITVRDTGPGFPPTVLQEQFVPYMSTKPHGSGLGLVISQRIAHDHGGSIELGNHEQGGGIVTVRLPQ